MNDDITTVSGLAAAALVTEQAVRDNIRRGTLKASKVEGKWVIDEASARAYVERGRPGPPSQRQLEAISLGITDQALKSRRQQTRRRQGTKGNDASGQSALEAPANSLARKKAETDLEMKQIRLRREAIGLGKDENSLYEAEAVEGAFRRLAGLACSIMRQYANAIPLLVDEHLPADIDPDVASRIKSEIARHTLAMVERDVGVLAQQTLELGTP